MTGIQTAAGIADENATATSRGKPESSLNLSITENGETFDSHVSGSATRRRMRAAGRMAGPYPLRVTRTTHRLEQSSQQFPTHCAVQPRGSSIQYRGADSGRGSVPLCRENSSGCPMAAGLRRKEWSRSDWG